MSTTAPFGTWPSPITPGTITTRTVLLSQVRVDGADTYWVEQRASQAGRNVLLRRNGDGQIGEVLPLTPADELVDVRTRVHEYGGRAYAVDSGIIVVSHAGDGRLYRYDVAHRMRGLVPLTIYGDVRHGDLEIDTGRGLVYAVREDHRGGGTGLGGGEHAERGQDYDHRNQHGCGDPCLRHGGGGFGLDDVLHGILLVSAEQLTSPARQRVNFAGAGGGANPLWCTTNDMPDRPGGLCGSDPL